MVRPVEGQGFWLRVRLRQLLGAHPVSGEDLARQLGMSRAAIWKYVEQLRQLGYGIEGTPRRGYVLTRVPDLLLPEEVVPLLTTTRFGRTYLHRERVGSTSDEVARLAEQGAPEGTVVVAEYQEAGRGRLGRTWSAPPRTSILCSLLLRPPVPPVRVPFLSLLFGVGAAEVLRAQGFPAGLKWPNDVLLDGRKVAGILTEMSGDVERVRSVVVGCGINVLQAEKELPQEGVPATSLRAWGGQAVARAPLLAALLARWESLYDLFLAGRDGEILDRWRSLAVHLQRPVTVRAGAEVFTGVAEDVEDDGALRIRTPEGTRLVRAGEVSLRIPDLPM